MNQYKKRMLTLWKHLTRNAAAHVHTPIYIYTHTCCIFPLLFFLRSRRHRANENRARALKELPQLSSLLPAKTTLGFFASADRQVHEILFPLSQSVFSYCILSLSFSLAACTYIPRPQYSVRGYCFKYESMFLRVDDKLVAFYTSRSPFKQSTACSGNRNFAGAR